MYLDQPMLEEPNATLYQNVPPLGEEAGTSIPENLNSWLHSHLEDAHVESMDWESSDVNVLPSMEVFEASYCWHIVVDTNVLLDSLEFVHQLRDLHNKKFGLTVIAIPWAALQELDRFKSEKSKNPKLREPAKRAIAFIHKSFSMSHPKLIGQFSLDEDIKPIRITYDDSIIKYSLTLKCEGKNVILLTEDKNLCNKATTAQLECHSVNGLKEWINFALNGAVEKDEAVEKNDDAELLNDVPAGVVIKCAKKTMVKFLGKVLETEMKSIYNEMWSKVILIKPPWSFEDILKCYEKHWIAALSSLFQKPALDVVKKMIKAPAFKYSQTWELIRKAEVLEALDMCIELCSSLKSVKYTPHSLQAIEQLKPLKEQLKSGKVIASPTEDLCLSSSGFSESIEKDKINHCLNSTFQSINSFCCEVNRLVDGPYEKQLENAVGQSIMTYHRMIKSLIQLNEKLLSSKENCDIKDLTEMSALLLRTNMLKDQNSNIDSLSMIALREFYMSNRETLTQAQDVLLQSSNIVSRGMKRLMSFSQNTTSF
ncbi:Hypothetical predicted protein [Cloeon dipterum]|uniref:PIN domain-containing protein n=1 Tax=Cloeon dipterum TaxID=197152 RepID=A0A8S1DEN6_9INSE|nr:Hypothetical predicted protein [Cloeon dipterum]